MVSSPDSDVDVVLVSLVISSTVSPLQLGLERTLVSLIPPVIDSSAKARLEYLMLKVMR